MNWNILNRSKSKTRGPRKYRHLDGAPYETTGAMRYLRSPVVYSAVLMTMFYTTAQSLLSRSAISPMVDFAINLGVDGLGISVMMLMALRRANRDKGVVAIDLSGYDGGGDPQRTAEYAGRYMSLSDKTIGVSLGQFLMGSVIAGLHLLRMGSASAGLSVVEKILDELFWHLSYIIQSSALYMSVVGVLAGCAAGKLGRGEWKITHPPRVDVKKEEKVEAGVTERIRAFTPRAAPGAYRQISAHCVL